MIFSRMKSCENLGNVFNKFFEFNGSMQRVKSKNVNKKDFVILNIESYLTSGNLFETGKFKLPLSERSGYGFVAFNCNCF